MQVWDAAGQAYIRYEAADVGEAHIGYVVENSRIQAAIVEQITAQVRCGLQGLGFCALCVAGWGSSFATSVAKQRSRSQPRCNARPLRRCRSVSMCAAIFCTRQGCASRQYLHVNARLSAHSFAGCAARQCRAAGARVTEDFEPSQRHQPKCAQSNSKGRH